MLDFENNLGFIILLTEFRFNGLRSTISTIKTNFNNSDYLCVVPKESNEEDFKTATKICKTIKARDTISSMINTGIQESKKPWNLVVVSGNLIKHSPVMKYKRFLKSKKDIIYRVVDKSYWKWEDASIHGLLMHKDAIKEIGTLPENEESLQTCKLLWAACAIEKGYKFKGLVGVKL